MEYNKNQVKMFCVTYFNEKRKQEGRNESKYPILRLR